MRTIAATVAITLLALVGGFLAGIVLSELIGIIGWLAFHSPVGFKLVSPVGFKLVPVVAALAAAGAAVVVNQRARRRAGQTATHSTVHHRP
jgi:O-antigen ligase